MTTNGTEKRPLPDGWTWATLGEVTNPERNRVKPQEFGDLPFIGMDDVESETMRLLNTKSSSEMKSSSEHFWPDDVLYGSLRPYLNKVYRPDFEGLCSAEFIVFRSAPHLESKYLQYFLNQWSFVAFINKQNTGDRPRVKFRQMEDYPFPFVPLPEQERIVAEIEKQFTRLDQGVASLRRLQSNLARYKASVLKAACDGRLVPQDPNDEPAADLLARILAERRAQWQAANPGKKYKEPVGVEEDTAVLPALPEGWVWATLEQCFDVSRGRFSIRPRNDPRYYDGSHPFVQIGDLPRDGGSIIQASKTLNDKGLEVSKKFPKGTVLIAIVGATIGNTGVLTFDSCSPDSLVAFQAQNQVRLQFLELYLRSMKHEIRAASYASGGQPNINLAFLLPYPISVPPLAEQERIVAEVERRLSVVAATEQAITTNLSRAERLRQSILHRAFTGQLV